METLRKQKSAQKPAITKPAPAHIAIRYFMVPLLNSAGEWRGRVGPSSAGDSRTANVQHGECSACRGCASTRRWLLYKSQRGRFVLRWQRQWSRIESMHSSGWLRWP